MSRGIRIPKAEGGIDEWQFDEGGVARGKLHSSLCSTSPSSPFPPLPCSLIISKELCSEVFLLKLPENFLLALSLPLSAPKANSTCQIKQATGLHNTVTLSPHSSEKLSFLEKKINIKAWQWLQEKKRVREKKALRGRGELNSLHHSPTADKEILFWRKIGFGQHNVCSLTLAWTAQVLTQSVRLNVSVRNPDLFPWS